MKRDPFMEAGAECHHEGVGVWPTCQSLRFLLCALGSAYLLPGKHRAVQCSVIPRSSS